MASYDKAIFFLNLMHVSRQTAAHKDTFVGVYVDCFRIATLLHPGILLCSKQNRTPLAVKHPTN